MLSLSQEIMQHKLVFIETQDVVETTLALDNYRKACDCGRGAIFFSVARYCMSPTRMLFFPFKFFSGVKSCLYMLKSIILEFLTVFNLCSLLVLLHLAKVEILV